MSSNMYELFYKKRIPLIEEKNLTIITPREDGLLVKDINNQLLWLSFDNKIFNTSSGLLFNQPLIEINEEEKKTAIKQIMGLEKEISFSYENYILISKINGNDLEQKVYYNEKEIGFGKLYKTKNGYRNIIIDNEENIYADNIYEFVYIIENNIKNKLIK